ncbi:MAG TPA: hypothetical protein VFH11_00495 [Gemmatimonadota bacterium]|nr:hypothetical protein [Gemmatimonadota bacterium]
MNKKCTLLVAYTVTLSAACDDHSTGPEADDASLNGLFYGTVEGLEVDRDNPFSHTVNLTLTEYLGTLSGSFSITGAYGSGTVTGTIDGPTVSFAFHQTDPCPGNFTGTATFDGDRLIGTFSGAGCRGNVTANLEVNRTPPVIPLS